jgi:tetratricopeptide (TPR) repeat protein
VVQPPIVLAGGPAERREVNPQDPLAFEELPKPIDPLPAGARPGQFIVITPRKAFPEPGRINMGVDRVAAASRPPVFRFDPFARRVKVEAEARNVDPVQEAVRLVELGRSAFVAGEYGKAAEQFERASASNAKLARAHFLRGQAAFAAGRYSDAVDAIRLGLTLNPEWPATSFDPKEPYGPNVADFANHLAELRKAMAVNPDEPTLEFLLGYQLWFVGERAEARKWFDLAAERLADRGPLGLFK